MKKIELDRKSDKPLYAQLRDAVIAAIKGGALKPGDKLPPVTLFAKEVKVTQSTIIRAFKDLTQQNFISSFVGRGTFVNDSAKAGKPVEGLSNTPYSRSPLESADPDFAHAARRLRMGISKSLEALDVLHRRPNLIKFTSGVPDASLAEPRLLEKCIQGAMKQETSQYLEYLPPPGLKGLRETIAARYSKCGAPVTAEHVLITSGSQQAVSILAQLALESKYRVVCESPCYMGIPNAFGAIGHWVETLPRDEEGPIPERLAHYHDGRQTMLYLCSVLHNPMGTDLSRARAELLKQWAEEQNSIIISDEIFRDLHFAKEPPNHFFGRFGKGRSVVVGSLSKSFMCGLRIGWIIAEPELVRSLSSLKRAMDLGCPPLMQGIALAAMESGKYDEHIRKGAAHYKERRDAALKALKEYMPPGVRWTRPEGGFHLWAELPQGYSSIALFLLAAERGVAFMTGPQMDLDHRFINAFKLSYGSLLPAKIKEGVELLGDAAKTLLKNPPSDSRLPGVADFL